MTLYKNQYRIESTRLKDWDYSCYGYYFVTICTKDKQCFFGNIKGDRMQLSGIGKIVAEEWQNTGKVREEVKLDEWVIMPNHLHGIVIIQNDDKNVKTHGHASQKPYIPSEDAFNESLHINTPSGDAFNASLRKNNLSSIIRGFKSASTKNILKKGFTNFAWHLDFMTTLSEMRRNYRKSGSMFYTTR